MYSKFWRCNQRQLLQQKQAQFFLGFGMAFAAGAMIFVVVDEIIPETHGKEYARLVTFGVIIGFVIMMFLDNFIEPILSNLIGPVT